MKWVISLIFIFIIPNNSFAQKLYYQCNYSLIKNDKEAEVSFQDSVYNIYQGFVSPKGNYVGGFLIKGALKEELNSKRRETTRRIVDNFSGYEPFPKIFIIYSCFNKRIVYMDTLKYYYPDVMFSEDEKYVLLPFDYVEDKPSKLINLEDGRIECEFPEEYKNFKWVDNELYFLFDGGVKYILCHYNKNKEQKCRTDDIFFIYKEETYKKFDDYSFEIVDSLRVLFRYKTEEGTWLKLIEKDKTITLFGAEYIRIDYVYDDNILFSVTRDYGGSPILYSLNLENNDINRLFTMKDVTDALPNIAIFGYSSLFQIKNDIYFISTIGGPRDLENIIKYNIPTKKFSLVTKKGYISAPIGYFEE